MTITEEFRTLLAEARAQAIAAKEAGRAVVGFMGPVIPLEVFDAAGVFALPLCGDSDAPTPLADRYMEPLFDKRVRAALQAILAGEWSMLDLIVLSRTSDSQQRFYYYLCELRRMGLSVPPAKLYDLLHTDAETSAAYNLARTHELRAEIGALAGVKISDEALRGAIARRNTAREAARKLAALRQAVPARLGGEEALNALAAWRVVPPESYVTAADLVVERARQRLEGPRVVIAGSVRERPDLHRMLGDLGAVVVGDYHQNGEPAIGPSIAETGDPVAAISAHYHRAIMSSRRYPFDAGAVTRFARAAHADAVIFYFDAEEEALTWDYPAQRRDLEVAGVRVLAFADQPKLFSADALRPATQAFLAGLNARVAGVGGA